MTRADAVADGEVAEAFDEVADRYDLMVALNPGYHRHLRQAARRLVAALPDPPSAGSHPGPAAPLGTAPHPLHVVDLGCGSGASTRALVAALGDCRRPWRLLGVDASAGMLEQASAKRWPPAVQFAQARAERLPDLPEVRDAAARGGLDGVLAAYLVRNVAARDELLRSLHGALRPGGVLVVHDYSVAGRPLATLVWSLVCWGVVVPLGWLTSRRTRLYRYLWRSVIDMDAVDVLLARLEDAGFVDVAAQTVRGWQHGIIHTVTARRPG